ncbi:MAG TPA: universal stress protein [Gaiellaceae bacterium]|nr:universal stress protein [Gaiellaceae bacterium]
MAARENLIPSPGAVEALFGRVLVGVDGSAEALEAARQAAILVDPDGELALVAAWSLAPPLVAPLAVLPPFDGDADRARLQAETALAEAQKAVSATSAVVVHGFAPQALLDRIERSHDTLVAAGSHGVGRAAGIFAGSTVTELVHRAPCSVLVARGDGRWGPRRILVGVDGSPHSALAHAAARQLRDRFDGTLSVVVAEGSEAIDLGAVSLIAGDGFHVISDDPVAVLTAAAADADLLVLGSRGLRGLKALGSVSERVAHRAPCSTLIVRGG